ncbi:MAG: PKD domain-containing protein [Bacteroidales bacterium]|nr:PKD domain-containing protein [Bacteroidales bacterium]
MRNQVYEYLIDKYSTIVSLGQDIASLCDIDVSAYNPDFISYQWSTGETSPVINVSRNGNYSVTVTNSLGVTSTDDINVYFPEVYQLQDTAICAGDTIYWNTGLDDDGYTFQWMKDGIQYADAGILGISEEGRYSCIITDSLGCRMETDTIQVGIDEYPRTTSFMADGTCSVQTDTAMCSGNTLGLATNIEETIDYIWNTGATSSRITLTETGDYTLTTTNSRGCRAVNLIHVNILGEAPEINYAIDNLCFGDSTSFIGNAQSQQGIESYLWIIDAIDSIASNSFKYEFATTGIHNIRTIVTSNNSCRNDSSFNIVIKEIARPDFTFTPVCYGVPMDFIDNSTIPEGTTVEEYTWMVGDEVVGDEENLRYTFGTSATLSDRTTTQRHSDIGTQRHKDTVTQRHGDTETRRHRDTTTQRYDDRATGRDNEISSFVKHIVTLSNGCTSDTTIEVTIRNEYAEPRYVSCAYPTDGMLVNTDSIRFEWNYDYDILYYNLITSSSPDFSNADTIACTTNNITLPYENFADTAYWKVTSYNHCLLSFESETYFFHKIACNSSSVSENSNLQLWLRADSVELTDGKVSRWYDLSPNQYEIAQTNANARPTINESALNGNPVLQFNGTSTFLDGGDILDLETESWTWVIVGMPTNSNSWASFFSKADRNATSGRYSLSTKTLYYFINLSNYYEISIPSYEQYANIWHVTTWENNRLNNRNIIYKNGNTCISSAFVNSNMDNSLSFKIGSYSTDSPHTNEYYLNGKIAEIIAFNTVDSTLRKQVYNYLYAKYVATVSLGLDIHTTSFCDTTISAYMPDFISYQWSTGETDSVIHVNRSGRYTVTVTNSFGVTSTDDINVYFPEHNQLQDTTICVGDTILWNIKMRQDEYAFQWYKDGEQYGDASNQIEISEAGAYSCIITDSLGCTFQTDTAHITIDNYPISASFRADGTCSVQTDTTLCYGNRLHIAYGYSETVSAIWNDGTTDLEYYLTQPGTYSVTVTNNRGCQSSASINVNLSGQVPTPDFSIEGHCQNAEVTATNLSYSTIGDITLYKWFANDSLIGTTENISHSFEQHGTQSLRLYLETSDQCFNDTTIFVYIDPQPQPDFSPKSFCQNAETEINTQHAIAEGEIVSTLWSIEGETLYGDNISKSFAGTDLVPVTITAESAVGCSGSHTYEVVVRQTEIPAMNISGLCLGSGTAFSNETPFSNTNPQIAWEWDFGDNTGISTRKNPTHYYSTTGNYNISMSVTFANHCTTSIDTTISIYSQPTANITTTNGCVGGQTEMLADISTDDHIYNYRWNIGDIYESSETQPIFIADSAGIFPVSFGITTDHMCTAEATGTLNIHGQLNVSFRQSRDWGGNPLYVEFENTSEGVSSYHWDFGGAGESNQTNPYFIFTEPGTYNVSLTGTNEYGCSSRFVAPTITVVEPIVDIMLMNLSAKEENGFARISLVVVNMGTLPVEELVLELKVNNQIYRETIGHIAQGEVVPHTFGTMIPILHSTDIANTICVEALVPDTEGHSDIDLSNNSICVSGSDNLSVGNPYPIPASEQITCDIYTKAATDLDIAIFSIYGKLVKHETISQHKGYLKYVANVSELSAGMYFIRVIGGDERITNKFEVR